MARPALVVLATAAALTGIWFAWPLIANSAESPVVGDWYADTDPGVLMRTRIGGDMLRIGIGERGQLLQHEFPGHDVARSSFGLHEEVDGVPGRTGTEDPRANADHGPSSGTHQQAFGFHFAGHASKPFVLSSSVQPVGAAPIERRVALLLSGGPIPSPDWQELAAALDLHTVLRWNCTAAGLGLEVMNTSDAGGAEHAIERFEVTFGERRLAGEPQTDGGSRVLISPGDVASLAGPLNIQIDGTRGAHGLVWTIAIKRA